MNNTLLSSVERKFAKTKKRFTVCNRMIFGKRCKCYADYIYFNGSYYLKLSYFVDGKEPSTCDRFVDAMYKIAENKADKLTKKGFNIVFWIY